MAEAFMCSVCGDRFEVPQSVRDRYPGWTPRTCMDCRAKAPAKGSARRGGNGRSNRSANLSQPKELNIPVAEVLERFTAGPQTGVFTDGSCAGNPGPGGWGAVRVLEGNILSERHGKDPATTNNRMELTAMIAGLEMLAPGESATVYSDSMLVVNTLTRWAAGWEARGWARREGEVKNLDLVKRAWSLVQERPDVRIEWIRAHDGSRWNEYADALSTAYLRDTV
jgi:ribonuclease HI